MVDKPIPADLQTYVSLICDHHQYLNHDLPIEQQETTLHETLDTIWTLLSYLKLGTVSATFKPKSNDLIDLGLISDFSADYIKRMHAEGSEDTNEIIVNGMIDDQGRPYYVIQEIYKDIHEKMLREDTEGKAPEFVRFDAYRAEATTIKKIDDRYEFDIQEYHNPARKPPFDTLVVPHVHLPDGSRIPYEVPPIDLPLNPEVYRPVERDNKARSLNTTVALLINALHIPKIGENNLPGFHERYCAPPYPGLRLYP